MSKKEIVNCFAWALDQAAQNLGVYTGGLGEIGFRRKLAKCETALQELKKDKNAKAHP